MKAVETLTDCPWVGLNGRFHDWPVSSDAEVEAAQSVTAQRVSTTLWGENNDDTRGQSTSQQHKTEQHTKERPQCFHWPAGRCRWAGRSPPPVWWLAERAAGNLSTETRLYISVTFSGITWTAGMTFWDVGRNSLWSSMPSLRGTFRQ